MVKEAGNAIQKVKADLGKKPEEAFEILKFLISKNKYELEEHGIANRTETILEVKKVISKRSLMIQLKDKFQTMELAMNTFMNKFDVLRQKGLPNPLVINDKIMRHEDYDKKMRKVAR